MSAGTVEKRTANGEASGGANAPSYRRSVLTGARAIAVEDAAMPDAVEPGWARLRLAAASLCGTDMHYFRHFANAGFELERPTTLGHEACGWVEKAEGLTDRDGTALSPGDLVAISPVIPCGECANCATGAINRCARKRFPGSATTKPHIDGFFRERFDFPAHCLLRVDPATNPRHLTFAEPLACALHCVNRAGVTADDTVLVTGCGPMGLLTVAACAARGATVHATDLNEGPLLAARAVGATETFGAGEPPEPAAYRVTIEASGATEGFNAALGALAPGGTLGVLSLIQPRPAPVNLHLVALREAHVVGSILYTVTEFDDSVALIASGTIDIDAITAGVWSIDRVQEACEAMAEGATVGKVVIAP